MEDRTVEGTGSGRRLFSPCQITVLCDRLTRYGSDLSYVLHSCGDNRMSSGTDPSHIASCSLVLCCCEVIACKGV